MTAAATLAIYLLQLERNQHRIPYHTSALTGLAWVHELLNGHPKRIVVELSVQKHMFKALLNEL